MRLTDCAALGLLIIVATVGCRSLASVTVKKKEASTRSYGVTPEQALATSEAVLRAAGFELVEVDRQEGRILAEIPIGFWSWGSVVGVWVTPRPNTGCKVSYLSLRRVAYFTMEQLSEWRFRDALEKRLGKASCVPPLAR